MKLIEIGMTNVTKFVCKHPFSHFEINNPNGDVTMCCNNGWVLGNVNQNTVAEIWNGEGFRTARQRMLDDGAHAMCPHTCPVLQGGKRYEDMSWYTDLDPASPVRKNAELNEREFDTGVIELESEPRWFRFTYSYACNLDCYHCYQREDATLHRKLPESFMAELPRYAKIAQIFFPFGGEPFFFAPIRELLTKLAGRIEGKFFFITNGTLLTEQVYEMFEASNIATITVSLDAAARESFEKLRLRGRNASWDAVMTNLKRLQALKRRKGLTFTVSMTVNAVNAREIESFVDLALAYDAEPILLLVANPYQTSGFQREYLTFSAEQIDEMLAQIDRSIVKVRERQMPGAEIHLRHLRTTVLQHRIVNNRPVLFALKNAARRTLRLLPPPLRAIAAKWVQDFRVRQFEALGTRDA